MSHCWWSIYQPDECREEAGCVCVSGAMEGGKVCHCRCSVLWSGGREQEGGVGKSTAAREENTDRKDILDDRFNDLKKRQIDEKVMD